MIYQEVLIKTPVCCYALLINCRLPHQYQWEGITRGLLFGLLLFIAALHYHDTMSLLFLKDALAPLFLECMHGILR